MRFLAATTLVAATLLPFTLTRAQDTRPVVSRSSAAVEVRGATPAAIYDRYSPSMVVIQFTFVGEPGRRDLRGPGLVIGDDGLIVSSIGLTPVAIPDEQMRDFKIIIPGEEQTELDAVWQGRDERSNLSFFRPKEKSDRKWTPVTFVDVKPEVGDSVWSVGILPEQAGYKTFLTRSTVAAHLRGPTPLVLVGSEGMPGPASPVFDSQGRAIGMVNIGADATILLNDPRQPLGAAANPARAFVPSSDFIEFLKNPPTPETPVNLPTIGIAQLSGLSRELAEAYDLKGKAAVQIGDIVPGRSAERAGLKAGMVIIALNGEPLERGDQPDETWQILLRKLQRSKAGDKVKLTVIPSRGEAARDIEVTLEDRPMQANKARRFFADDLGFSVRELVFNDTYERKLPADQKGVLVAFVRQQSSAASARLQMADLVTQFNGKPVESLDQFQKDFEEFRKAKPRDAVVLEVMRGPNTSIIRIEPPQ